MTKTIQAKTTTFKLKTTTFKLKTNLKAGGVDPDLMKGVDPDSPQGSQSNIENPIGKKARC